MYALDLGAQRPAATAGASVQLEDGLDGAALCYGPAGGVLASHRHWLVVEGLWANLKGKGGELANLTHATLAGVIAQAHHGIERVRRTPHLPYSFRRRPGLSVA
jgi:hypothetical protein